MVNSMFVFCAAGLFAYVCLRFYADDHCRLKWEKKHKENKRKFGCLDWQALNDKAWDGFAEKKGEANKLAGLKQMMIDKSSKIHHRKECVIENELVDYFVNEKIVYAYFDKPDNFKLSQFKYPEPLLLNLIIPKGLKEKAPCEFDACAVAGYSERWDDCVANGWARLDQNTNRVLIDVDSVVLSYSSPSGIKEYVYRYVGFNTKGIVFDEAMEEGIPVSDSNDLDIKSGAKMVVQFERVEGNA